MKEKKQTETETKIANTNNQREKQELANPRIRLERNWSIASLATGLPGANK